MTSRRARGIVAGLLGGIGLRAWVCVLTLLGFFFCRDFGGGVLVRGDSVERCYCVSPSHLEV